MKYVDLSLPLENDDAWSPWWARNRVTYQGHRFGAFVIRFLFGAKKQHLKTGLGWANENIALSTHGTTHMDAPWHYGPECEGRPAKTIDQVPLEWCHGPGVVLDIRHVDGNSAATLDDIRSALDPINHSLSPGEIVLIRTGNDQKWGSRDYYSSGPGVSAEATSWLIDQGIKVMGIDAWGWDAPLATQAENARGSNRSDVFWAAHYIGVEKEYCHMERLANLDQLPSTGFTVCAFPLKVKGGSAGPARVVAMIDEASS